MKGIKKRRILVSIDWFAPGYKAGGPIRSCVNFAFAMRDKFDIYVITGDRDFGESEAYPHVKTGVWISYAENIQVKYCDPSQMSVNFWRRELSVLSPEFVYLNNLFSINFSFLPLAAKSSLPASTRWIMAPRGMLHKGAIQYKSFKKYLYVWALKQLRLSKNLSFHATDEQEKEDIKRHFGKHAKVNTVSNFPYSHIKEWKTRKKESGKLAAIFFSRISPKKNLDYLLKLLEDFPYEMDLDILGPIEDSAYWRYCQKIIAQLPSHIQVSYLGVFPHHEVMDKLGDYHLFTLPTHGENFGHAIFEAIASACPVLISDQTPWKNLEQEKAGWDIPLDHIDQYRKVLTEMAEMDQNTWATWSLSTWNYGKKFLQESQIKQAYEELFYA